MLRGQYLNIFFGSLIVSYFIYIFYVRIFTIKICYELPQNLFIAGHYGILITYLLFTFIFIFMFFVNLLNVLKISLFKPHGIFGVIIVWYDKCLESFFIFLVPRKVSLVGIFAIAAQSLETVAKRAKHKRLIVYALHVLPRSLMLITLAIDVFIFHAFYYSYVISFILILPLLGAFMHKTFEVFCEANFVQCDGIFIIVDLETKKKYPSKIYFFLWLGAGFGLEYPIKKLGYEFNPNYIQKQNLIYANKTSSWLPIETMNFHLSNYHEILLPLAAFTELYNMEKRSILKYFTLVSTGSYIVIFCYIICYCF